MSPTANRIHGFGPIASKDARLLILGSMPSLASLEANQYYAHPRNAFWKIMEALLDVPAAGSYPEKRRVLRTNGVAVWDVLRTCARESSLDSDIVDGSIVPNDFARFFATHRNIERVYFNGSKAESTFMKYVHPRLPAAAKLRYRRLPSTSPAHASMTLQQKISAWRSILR